MLRNEIAGDLWRGAVGMSGSAIAVASTMHESLDGWFRSASFVVGFLGSSAMLVSLCQRIVHTHIDRRNKDDDAKK
jgi:hypothetical protein